MDTIEVLDQSGHLSLRWDPAVPAEVARAREDAARLKAAGYSFFAVLGTPVDADNLEAGNGCLEVQRIEDPVRPPAGPPLDDPFFQGEGWHADPAAGGKAPPKRRGRPPKPVVAAAPDRRVVAVRPQRGG